MLEKLILECRCLPKFAMNGKAITGTIKIEGGKVSLLDLLPGQYLWIQGSVFNDGLHQQWDALQDETFDGEATPLAIPKSFVELAENVRQFDDKNKPTGMKSESFDGYSYQRESGKNGGAYTWRDAFRGELAQWRMI